MAFIHEDFLLHTKTARRLYHQFAAAEPILDYHCHLPPQDVAANLLGRQGYPDVYYHRLANPDLFTTFKRVKPFGVDDFRNPNVYTLDGRVEKEFGTRTRKVVILAESFNMLNRADILQVNERVNQASSNQVREILSPRIIRFGIRYTF